MRESLQLVMFDLDGTLVDTAGDISDAVNDLLFSLGLPSVDEAQVRGWIGHGSRRLLGRALIDCGAMSEAELALPERMEPLLEAYTHYYEQRCGLRSRPYPDVLATLDALLRAGVRLAVVSNREVRLARAVLRSHGLEGFFMPVIGGDTLSRRKPDALPLLHCLEQHGIRPEHALMVGDSAVDAAAARAAGVACYLVDYGYNGDQPVLQAGAERVISSIASLLP